MTSRERLLTALHGKMPDRVPANLYEINPYAEGTFYTNEESLRDTVELLKKEADSFAWGNVNLGLFHSDPKKTVIRYKTRKEGGSVFNYTEIETPKGLLTSETREDSGVATIWLLKPFVENDADLEKFLSLDYYPFQPDLTGFFEMEKVMLDGGKGVMLLSLADAVCEVAGLMNFEMFAMKSLEDKEGVLKLINMFQERILYQYGYIASRVKDTLFRLCGPEYLTPPLMPPSYFHDFVTVTDSELCKAIHKNSENRNLVGIHSHGKIGSVLGEMSTIGIDVLEPIESLPVNTADVTMQQVRDKLGSKICLMGNIQTRYLDYCSQEEIDAFVKTAIYEGGKNGGFVLIPTGAPIVYPLAEKIKENISHFFRSARKYGQYPIQQR